MSNEGNSLPDNPFLVYMGLIPFFMEVIAKKSIGEDGKRSIETWLDYYAKEVECTLFWDRILALQPLLSDRLPEASALIAKLDVEIAAFYERSCQEPASPCASKEASESWWRDYIKNTTDSKQCANAKWQLKDRLFYLRVHALWCE